MVYGIDSCANCEKWRHFTFWQGEPNRLTQKITQTIKTLIEKDQVKLAADLII